MKKITLSFFLLFTLVNNLIIAQTPDRWDTLYNTTAIQPDNYFSQCNNVVRNGLLFLYGDTINVYNSYYQHKSYIAAFNPTTSVLTPMAYNRAPEDHGLNGEATITTPTANVSFAFFGSKLSSSIQTNSLTLYKLNTLTQAVTYEQIAYPTPEYRNGIRSLCFFSPTTNHDTLLIFDDSLNLKTSIFKKHYNQVGFSNTNNLSIPFTQVYSSFVFNNVLYVSGYDNSTFQPELLTSTNGVTFTYNTNFTSVVGNYKIVATDIFNNILYFAIDDGDGIYKIYETPDGINFTQLYSSAGLVTSLKFYDNKIWYSVTSTGRPTVRYLTAPSFTNEITSVQDIGKQDSDPYTFKLNRLNSELYFAGNYIHAFQAPNEFGTFIYKFIPPVANITLNSNQLCLNSSYTATNSSLNADSVRWIKDNDFFAGTSNNFGFSFNTVGTHTLGIIAISGTQKDTLLISVNVYSVSLNINAPATACQVTPFQIQSTANNAQGTITYTWTQIPAFVTPPTVGSPTVSVLNPGSYSYYATMADVHGCSAISNTVSLNVFSSKNISGVVTETNSTIVAGDAVLYRYEPILTKFDSVTTQALNALGEYTFNTVDSGTYIVKCIPTASNNLQVTYGNSSISWLTAHVINHGCVNTSTQNISVIPIVSFGVGTGILTGQITQGPGYGQRTNGTSMVGPIKGVIVKGGRNPGGDIGAQSRTNAQGQYTLSGLPVNAANENYFVLVDIPGLDTNTTYHRIITATNQQFDNLDFTVDSAKINPIGNFVGVKELSFADNKVRLYPNPTNGQINVDFELASPSQVKVEVVDILGRVVKTILPVSYYNQNEVKLSSNIDGVPQGVYFVNIKIDHSQVSIKVIITD